MEQDFMHFKLFKIVGNIAIYISKSGACVTFGHKRGLCFPKYIINHSPHGHSCYPRFYISFTISKGKLKTLHFLPHRAVAQTYLPNHDIFKTQVDHLDGNIFNNHLWNLEWVTPEENIRRAAEARCLKKLKVKS